MKKCNLGDSELVSLYKSGNEWAFKVLLLRYKSKIFNSIHSIVRDRAVAEDLLQEVFVKFINTLRDGKYNEEGKFIQWISRVAHNLAIDHTRRMKRVPMRSADENDFIYNTTHYAEDSGEMQGIKKEEQQLMRTLIKRLPSAQRRVLIMRHYYDMSFQEIADSTNVSINTALGRMRYALINLRKQYDSVKHEAVKMSTAE